jgi:hypothetical protein
MSLNPDWAGKLISSNNELPDEKQIEIFNRFKREDIFEHKYNSNDLFKVFYSKHKRPKRQPNAFMIMRAILGLVAEKQKIKGKLGDGKQQSKLAGLIWKGANENEQRKFRILAAQFKELHLEHFPSYSFKPRPRSSEIGAVVDIKTAEYYQNPSSISAALSIVTNDYSNSQPDPSIGLDIDSTTTNSYSSQQFDSPVNAYKQSGTSPTDALDENTIINGYPEQQLDPQQQLDPPVNTYDEFDGNTFIYGYNDTPSIAVNCPSFSFQDPNTSQVTALNPYRNPYNPSSTFHRVPDNDNRSFTSKKH